ncbi:MAG: recombinase family protein [Lachnospiraceae bacterium]|nr:recombinase family protein [Lachnospiraceae bacterium]
MIRAYARVSRPSQKIERQITNILKAYPDAKIYQEAYTGRKIDGRKQFQKMLDDAEPNDTIVFDSVSRMSRTSSTGVEIYFDLYDRGINLVFLKEPYINTETYANNLKNKIELQGTDEDAIFEGLNNYFRLLAKKQIHIAFDQAEKEVQDLRIRTSEGMREARKKGKQIGQAKGSKLNVKKSFVAKDIMRKHCKEFGGTLSDKEVMRLAGISHNTYAKYKRELREEYQCS